MATRRKFAVRKSLRRRPKKSKLPATSRARVKKTKKPHYVYYFGDGHADGSGGMKPLLGGKGANLHEMTRIGLPVPPGFTITTEPDLPPRAESGSRGRAGKSRNFRRKKI